MSTIYTLMGKYVTHDEVDFIGAIDTEFTAYATKEDAEFAADFLSTALEDYDSDLEFDLTYHCDRAELVQVIVRPVTVI